MSELPALDRIIRVARAKREQRGAARDGSVKVPALSDEEAYALDGLLAAFLPRRRAVLPGRSLSIKLSELEAALRASGVDPRGAYERVGSASLRDLPAERAAARDAREDFRRWVSSHPVVVTRPAVERWVGEALGLGRLHPAMRPVVERALRVLAALPAASPLQRTVLAARLLDGDPHALDPGTPVHGLVVTLLRAEAGLGPAVGARAVWRCFGVLVDPMSSNVLGLGLALSGEGAAARLAEAAGGGHVVLTYAQLSAGTSTWLAAVPCFSCENPSVLIAAEQCLGRRCPPLVCTAGYPSDAARRLLSVVVAAGGEIRHHGDFDAAGVAIFRDLSDAYGAVPWRFDVGDLGPWLGPGPVSSLEDAVARLPRPVPEELVLDGLLSDLQAASAVVRGLVEAGSELSIASPPPARSLQLDRTSRRT